jgi:hypothetical protein
MRVNYRAGDHPILFQVTSNGKPLSRWQAYTSYQLIGGFVLYGKCAEGFEVDRVFGPAALVFCLATPQLSGDLLERFRGLR